MDKENHYRTFHNRIIHCDWGDTTFIIAFINSLFLTIASMHYLSNKIFNGWMDWVRKFGPITRLYETSRALGSWSGMQTHKEGNHLMASPLRWLEADFRSESRRSSAKTEGWINVLKQRMWTARNSTVALSKNWELSRFLTIWSTAKKSIEKIERTSEVGKEMSLTKRQGKVCNVYWRD